MSQYPARVTLDVSAPEFNAIRGALGRLPHDDVRPLIESLDLQVRAQIEAHQAQKGDPAAGTD